MTWQSVCSIYLRFQSLSGKSVRGSCFLSFMGDFHVVKATVAALPKCQSKFEQSVSTEFVKSKAVKYCILF